MKLKMGLILNIAILGPLTFGSGFASANDECMDKAVSTVDMMNCLDIQYKTVDAKLNETYKKLVALFDNQNNEAEKEQKRRLVEAEKGWLHYRDSNCDFTSSTMLGGTGEPLLHLNCIIGMTEARVTELERYYNEFMGD